jgi:hypothetical protein
MVKKWAGSHPMVKMGRNISSNGKKWAGISHPMVKNWQEYLIHW